MPAWWSNLSNVQKIGLVAGGGVAGLWGLSKMGGGSAGVSVGDAGSGLNILDVRRPTDDINAPGSRDPLIPLLRDIFRDQQKVPQVPTTPPGTTTPGGTTPPSTGAKFGHLMRSGVMRAGGKTIRAGRGWQDNAIITKSGQVFRAGEVGISRWNALRRSELGLAAVPDPRRAKDRAAIRPSRPEPPPNNGKLPPRKYGPTRGTGAGR